MYKIENQNYFKAVKIVNDVVAQVLRDVFIAEWNSQHPRWNDDAASLAAFDVIVRPHLPKKPAVIDLHNRLMKTSGNHKEWDTTLLFYCFKSRALNLKYHNPVLFKYVESLKKKRNDTCHKSKASLSERNFSQFCQEIEMIVQGLGPNYQSYLDQIILIKNSILPPSKEEIKRTKKYLEEKKKAFIRNVFAVSFAVFLLLILFWFRYRLVKIEMDKDSPLETTFPDNKVPVYFIGRTVEIDNTVTSILSGNHIEIFTGPPGIGKTTAALVVGQTLRDVHGYNVTFVSVKDQYDIEVVAHEILKSFHFTPTHFTKDVFKYFLRERLKHKTVIVLDNMEDILQSPELHKQTLQLLLDMLDSNTNTHFLCTSRKSFSLLGFNVNLNVIKNLSLEDSVTILQILHNNITEEDAEELATLCYGVPILLTLFGKQLSSSNTPKQVIDRIRDSGILQEAENESLPDIHNVVKLIGTLFSMLDKDLRQAFLSFSVFPVSFSRDASEYIVPSAFEKITKLVKFSVVEKDIASSRFIIHPLLQEFAQIKCNETRTLTEHCNSSEVSFHNYFISFISARTKQFFVKKSQRSFAILQEESANIKKTLDSALKYPSLFDQYYDMIVTASDMLLFGVDDKLFSKYFDKAASFAKDNNDFEKYMALLFLQGDRGDVYFYHHKDKYDKIQKLADTELDLIKDENTCKGMGNAREFGMCLCAKARAYALYASRKDWSPKVSVFNVSMAFDLIHKAKDIFQQRGLKNELAIAFSLMGLLKKNWGNYTEAVEVYTKSLNIYLELYSEHACTAAAYYNIGYMYMKMGGKHFKDAAESFKISYKIYKSALGNHRRTAAAIYHAGKSIRLFGNVEEALEYLSLAHEIQDKVNRTTRDTAETLGEIANVMFILKRYKQAYEYAQKSLNIMLVPGVMSELKHRETAFTYRFIGDCQRRLGQKAEAMTSYNKAVDIFDHVCKKKNRACEMIDIVKRDMDTLVNDADRPEEEESSSHILDNLYRCFVAFLEWLYYLPLYGY